ncbi:MAG: anhydro-N-acetylmuramic acid kinase [Planctomycetaceae bacterium]|jgi:anhydro-N-acetylmuramic acid kinase|nr:anhydro-N-acetylmuramic acid kinase [Planctomycetaceae bacterium]
MFGVSQKNPANVRWFAGVSITSSCRRIESAMIGVHGRGSGAPIEIRKTISFDIPREITDCFDDLQRSIEYQDQYNAEKNDFDIKMPVTLHLHVMRELASIEEEAVNELLSESRLTANDVLAVGINDPGVRIATNNGLYYHALCDAAWLSCQTGLNLVDAFPAQDIASRGNGGPFFPLPAWIFLKSETAGRILIDLGRTARLTFLPKAENAFSHQKIRHFDIVPCGSLLDTLVWQLTGGKAAWDTGGRFAVQGCQIPQLMNALRAVMPPQTDLPKEDWSPFGLKPDRYLAAADQAAQEGFPHQDILCTVSAFLAETIAGQVMKTITETQSVLETGEPELLVQGGCRQHGLLMNALSSHLGKRTIVPSSQLGIPVETFDAICTAVLAVLATDQVPGSLPHLTGSEAAKTLGRFTPGTISNWHRLLSEMSGTKPANRPLRSAM